MGKKAMSPKGVIDAAAAGRPIPKDLKPLLERALSGVELPETEGRRRSLGACRRISLKLGIPKRLESLEELQGRVISAYQRDALLEHTQSYRRIIEFAMRSEDPAGYLRFLARNELDIPRFIDSGSVFAERRIPEFIDVPEKEWALGDDILEAMEHKTDSALRSLARNLMEYYRSASDLEPDMQILMFLDGIEAVIWCITDDHEIALDTIREELPDEMRRNSELTGYANSMMDEVACEKEDMMVAAKPVLLTFGIYPHIYGAEHQPGGALRDWLFRFRSIFKFGGINGYVIINDKDYRRATSRRGEAYGMDVLLTSKDESLFHHEIQHIFDKLVGLNKGPVIKECRAYLAELAFSSDPATELERLIRRQMSIHSLIHHTKHREAVHMALKRMRESSVTWRIEGYDLCGPTRVSMDHCNNELISRAAMGILNDMYKKKCGLSYDEIVEPFRKG